MEKTIRFVLNGKKTEITTEPNQTLLWVLRNQLGLTGTKYGCGTGFCGACTVLINKEPSRSCSLPVSDVAGKDVITIEGLSKDGELHPVQKAFVEHDALQCGFCTPGMILRSLALLRQQPHPTEAEVIAFMDRNLCRCGAHPRIVKAILNAATQMRAA